MLRSVIAACLVVVAAGCGNADRGALVLVQPRAVDPGGSERSSVRIGSGGKVFGVNDQTWLFTGGPQPELDQGVTAQRELAEVRALGADAIRVTISWYDVEPQPGRYDDAYVARVKALTDSLERRGGRALLVLGVPPAWARAEKSSPSSTILDSDRLVERFGAFAGFVARTWPRAAAIETWNEPNTRYFWRPRRPEPALFTRMHRAAAVAIRSARTPAKVVLGSILATSPGNPNVVGAQRWLKALYAEGLRPADYDAIGFHPYPVPRSGVVPPLGRGEWARSVDDFRLGYRDTDPGARIWITEVGYTTTGSWGIDETTRARALPALIRKLASLPEVDAVFVHALYVPTRYPATSIQRGFGLVVARGAAPAVVTPTFCALRRLTGVTSAEARC